MPPLTLRETCQFSGGVPDNSPLVHVILRMKGCAILADFPDLASLFFVFAPFLCVSGPFSAAFSCHGRPGMRVHTRFELAMPPLTLYNRGRMNKLPLLLLSLSLPALAVDDLPPLIPTGPVEYSNEPALESAPPLNTDTGNPFLTESEPAASSPAPLTTTGNNGKGYVRLNAFTSHYNVRGMGVEHGLSKWGFSSLDASYTLPNDNLLNWGLQARIAAGADLIWGSPTPLGKDTPLRFRAAIGKEIFPNLLVEVGYTIRRAGFEGFMATEGRGSANHTTQDLFLCATFDDHGKGFFGHALWGFGFQGLTGSYFDIEGGYRFTDVIAAGNIGSDLEVSVGVAPSLGYWGRNVEGIDDVRVRVALQPFSQTGSFGRDAHLYFTPWVQLAWAGSNRNKIRHITGHKTVSNAQLTFGLEAGWKF